MEASMSADKVEMVRVKPFNENLRYSSKNWSAKFECPDCGSVKWINLNFLGRRKAYCVGGKLVKE
jgi:predicted RNA-binding Zn-ribbon protein involved in translation (DUF1610 family)